MGQFQEWKTQSIRSAAILTTGYVAGTVLSNVELSNQLVVLVDYTKGSLDDIRVKVEFSSDNTNWYQETFGAISATVETISLGEHKLVSTGKYRLPIEVKDRYIRVSVKGTGTVTNSSCTLDAVIGVS